MEECRVTVSADWVGLDMVRVQAIRIWIERLQPTVEDGILWLTVPAAGEAGRLWLAALTSGAPTEIGVYRSPVELAHIRQAAGVAVGLRVRS